MGVKPSIINSVLCVTLVLLAYSSTGIYGFEICQSTSFLQSTRICDDGYHCCGTYNNECCAINIVPSGSRSQEQAMEVVATFIVLMAFTCCCICCYRCCCRRTTSRGFVYSAPGTTTAVSVSLPPQQAMPPQQVPYPTVVPYPQQMPLPPQYNPPTNPYYGMPPPAYGVAVQSANQQASAPSAPYMQS